MNNNSQLKHYFKQIRIMLPAYGKYERNFLKDFKNNVGEYTRENPHCSFRDITQHFGTPKDIIGDYLSSSTTEYLAKRIGRFRLIKNTAIVCIFLLIAGFSLKIGLETLDAYKFNEAYSNREIINIDSAGNATREKADEEKERIDEQ